MTEQIQSDLSFVRSILPNHYTVQESKKKGSIHCQSEIGIRKSPYLNPSTGNMVTDAEDDNRWKDVLQSLKSHFGDRFLEVYHNTCFCHVDFTIYIR
jgi:hypothetical protein